MSTFIYLVENCYNDPNKVYVGKTINPLQRERAHKCKYGHQISYHIIDKIDTLNVKEWMHLESYWIEQFRQWGFDIININKKGGNGPDFYSDEARLKMSLMKKGKPKSEEWKLRMSLSKKGKKRPLEDIEKMRKPKSEEHKLNMRKPKSEEHKLNISLGKKGKPRSKEDKLKLNK
jgi:hypothetical protein